MFVVFDETMSSNTSTELISSVYWRLQDKLFISLSGNVISLSNENDFTVKSKILEESSSTNLVKLFAKIQNVDNEPLKDLIESLMRLAQVNMNESASNNYTEHAHAHAHDTCSVYFQSSVIINGKREYPLYILKSNESLHDGNTFVIKELIENLTLIPTPSINEKINLIHDFYSKHSEAFDSEIFSIEQVYKSLRQTDEEYEEELGKIIKFAKMDHESILKFIGLTLEQVEKINFKEFEEIFDEMMKERTPKRKLDQLVRIHSKLTESSDSPVNADILLPLLTFVIIKTLNESGDGNISGEIRFIERFGRESDLSGMNGYIVTSTVSIG